MVWAVTARGQDTVTASSDNLVIPSFTPGANSLLLVALNHTDDAGSLSLSGHDDGMAWAQIFKSVGLTNEFELWACITGSSPSAGTITITKNYGWSYAAACVEITGDFDTAPTAMTDLFGTYQAVEQYTTDGDSTLDVTLSAFASANNMTLVLARDEAQISDDFSFTEVQISAGANNTDISVLWYDGEDTNPEIQFASWITVGLAAVEIKEAAGGDVSESVPSGILMLTGVAPTTAIVGNSSESIPSTTITLTGAAPSTAIVGNSSASIPSATLTLNGVAPGTATVGAPVTAESIPAGTLTLTGLAPGTENNYTGTDALELVGFAPGYAVVGNVSASIPAATLVLEGFAPALINVGLRTESIPAGGLELTGFAPAGQVVGNVRAAIPSNVIELSAYAPSTQQIGTQAEGIPAGVLELVGFAPVGRYPRPGGKKSAGGGPKTHKGRAVIIGNRRYVVYSYTEERYLLSKHLESLYRKQVKAQAVKTESYRKRRIKLLATAIDTTEQQLADVERKWRAEEEELLLMLVA